MAAPVDRKPGPTGGHAAPAAEMLFRRPWSFRHEAPTLAALPPADRPEVAFAGRSNVGKSSLINALTGIGGLARTSNTPGRTQSLIFFSPADEPLLYLVDMPGYGYAEAPKQLVQSWTQMLREYLRGRVVLARVFVLIDARHGIKESDRDMLRLLDEAAVSYQVVLTKIDKVSAPALARVEAATIAALASGHPAAFPGLLLTSAQKRLGIEALRDAVATAAGIGSGEADAL